MIKTCIAGADTKIAGDLIRILINHPEVDIRYLFAPQKTGVKASAVHYGLLGEEPLSFTDTIDLSKIDILYICQYSDYIASLIEKAAENEPKIIDVCGFSRNLADEDSEYVFGLSEIYRKNMVRGATKALLPSSLASVVLVALYPLAKNLLLNQSLKVNVEIPAEQPQSSGLTERSVNEIIKQLSSVQLSFADNGTELISISQRSDPERGIRVKISLSSRLSLEDLENIYEDIFEDHNFTVLSRRKHEMKEVLGTDKIVLSIAKSSSDTVDIEAIADEEMRGGAAEAVHIMNLLFGLHEKTGMNFLPSSR